MSDFYIKTDNTAEVLAAKNEAIMKALFMIGQQAEKNAKFIITKVVYDTPESPSYKRTGRLRNSISNFYDGNTVYLGTNVEYAPYVELGTYKMNIARPFIRPAIENHLQEYQEIFEKALKSG